MKRTLLSTALAASLILGAVDLAHAASFTYHGNLQDAGKPAEGSYDLELTLYSAPEGGKVLAGPLMMYKVPVHDGSFSTEADFGPLMNLKDQAWLGVKVRSADKGEFATLGARASIDASVTVASCPGAWGLQGNAGNQPDYYLGTSDNNPLVFEVNSIPAGKITPGKGVAFGQGGFGASANGQDGFATGEGVFASGLTSFAGGFAATVAQNGSYMWGDANTGGGIVATTGVGQYIVRAGGGMAVNGAPKNNAIELSIYPSFINGPNYSNIFLGNTGKLGGMLVSVGDESSTTSNDAKFYVDQFDGTTQTRKLIVDTNGLSINGPNTVDTSNNPALSVSANPSASNNFSAGVDFIPAGSNGYAGIFSDAQSAANSGYVEMFFQLTTKDNIQHIPLSLYTDTEAGTTTNGASISGDLTVSGSASKPGGGSWAVSSDRRIKQDIAPIHDALDTLMKLRPVNFHYTPEYRAMEGGLPDKSYAGFIAQEYADVFPTDVISTSKHVPGAAKNDPTILALDPNPALITTVAAVQELATHDQASSEHIAILERENAKVKRQNTVLQNQLDDLSVRLSKLENKQGE